MTKPPYARLLDGRMGEPCPSCGVTIIRAAPFWRQPVAGDSGRVVLLCPAGHLTLQGAPLQPGPAEAVGEPGPSAVKDTLF